MKNPLTPFILTAAFAGMAATAQAEDILRAAAPLAAQTKLSVSDGDKTSSLGVEEKFAAALYVSVQAPSMEWWFKLPPYSTPHISQLRKIYFNQEFSVFPFLENTETKDGRFKVKYTITMTSPDGRESAMVSDADFEGFKADKRTILACPDVLGVRFDKTFAEGLYRFRMTATDEASGETSEAENYVRLTEWSAPLPFDDEKIVTDFMTSFYLQPSPDTLYSIFFSEQLNLEQKDAPNSLNYSIIGFLQTGFKINRFLLWPIRESFKDMSPLNRAKTIFLFAITGEDKIDETLLSPAELEYQKKMREAEILDPYGEWDPALGATQIDMLWGEFFATGSYRPVRRVMDLLKYSAEAAYAEKIMSTNTKPQNKDEWRRFMLGMLNKVALITLSRMSYEIPLVESYCIWALQNGDLPKISYETLSPLFREVSETQKEMDLGEYDTPKIFLPDAPQQQPQKVNAPSEENGAKEAE